MWLMILMTNRWYARQYDDFDDLTRESALEKIEDYVSQGTVVSICDDLDTWCDELGVSVDDVTVVKDDDD